MFSLFRVSDNRTINILAFVTALFFFLLFRAGATHHLFNDDERIVPAVVAGMIQRGDLNGNWIVASGIPEGFHVNQFNFYSYHLFARLFYTEDPAQFVLILRIVNMALQGVTLIFLLSYIDKLGLGMRHRIMATAVFIAAPSLVFDTHIARCESFLYLLFVVLLWTTQLKISNTRRYALFGLILGVGTASKITFLLCAAVLLPEAIAAFRSDWRLALKSCAALLTAWVVGFVGSAPYVVVDFNGFLQGVNALFSQYGTEHPPHSYLHGSLGKSIFRTLHFILFTTGLLLPLGLFQLVRKRITAPGLAVFGFLLLGYFATKPVFFERNIGLGLLALSVFVALNIRTKAEVWIVAASCVLMMYWSVHFAYSFGTAHARESRFEMATFGELIPKYWKIENLDSLLSTCTGIAGLMDYNDDLSQKMIDDARALPVAHFTSVYTALPTSTIQTYLEADVNYYKCTPAAK
jgi:hypothetical protein